MRNLLVAALLLIPVGAHAAPSARDQYGAVLAREQALRASWGDGSAPHDADASLEQARRIVAAYERLVRRHPTSGYSDNALWQAGRLAWEAFERFGREPDRLQAIRLFQFLATNYPFSSLARKTTDAIQRLQSRKADQAFGRPSPTPTPPSPATPASFGKPDTPTPPPVVAERAEASRPAARAVVLLREIRREVLPQTVRVTIELEDEVPYHHERVANPDRMFVDLPGTRSVAPFLDATFNYPDDVVKQIKVGRHPNRMTRVVVDLTGVRRYTVSALHDPYRLIVECERDDAASRLDGTTSAPAALVPLTSTRTVASLARLPEAPSGIRISALPSAGPHVASEAGSRVDPPAASSMPAPGPEAGPPPTASTTSGSPGGFSLARQLGLGVARIVIDPGHGGHDSGARSKNVTEADLVLDVALRLEKLLAKQRGIEVILTRRTDTFVPLQERTAIANREAADLFLSIHANASANTSARGIETYYLNFASTPEAASVAARENTVSGQSMNSLPDIVKAIALNNKLDESRQLAATVQDAMLQRLKGMNKALKDLGVKQAPFVVLIGAAMPSVLAEISFITNRQEGQLLRNNSYRQRIAEALLEAVLQYQRSLKNGRAIAQQRP